MKEIKITKENLLRAHKEGCNDVKKVLETLVPEVFKKEIVFPCYAYNVCTEQYYIFRDETHCIRISRTKNTKSWYRFGITELADLHNGYFKVIDKLYMKEEVK
jgi:hypothetical protein